ncbi:MAG: DUF4249 domain-containing protein [Bacteroidetes bacterium]|nr:DUF4249 domain-containing protein [Bacteroidota bacterium]MBU1718073.1 DUF4249 domain-containing protein [Bacteroidota bacterium]
MLKNIVAIALLMGILAGCEKDITIDLPESERKTVIEGWIENGDYAMVLITRNSPYFSKIDSAAIIDMILINAKVTLTDGVQTEVLDPPPFPIPNNWDYFPPYVYKGKVIKGEVGKTYTLTVEADDQTYMAVTTIPAPVRFDSLWIEKNPAKGDTLGMLWARFTDGPDLGDYYRIFTKRIGNDRKFLPIMGSVYEDKFFNGKTFDFSMYRGFETLTDESQFEGPAAEEIGYFKVGDQIAVKLCAIDRAHFAFWRAAEAEFFTGGNPFATPAKIPTNFTGGALGYFGGYGATIDTLLVE